MFLMPGSREKRRMQDNHPRFTNALGADVALSSTTAYFDGPSVAVGGRGTWQVAGTVTLTDTAGAALFKVKMWDGTTVIAACDNQTTAALNVTCVTLSGVITAPQGNLRISVNDATSASGKIYSNVSGNGFKDSTISAVRIA